MSISKSQTSQIEIEPVPSKVNIVHVESKVDDYIEVNGAEDHDGLEYYDLPESLQGLTQEELKDLDKKTTRKVDLRLMPMLIYIYILNYLDRNNIAAARLGGLEDDLGLVGSQYQTCISVLFVGYILFQIPSNMLLNKIGKPSLYITSIMTVWGVISTCTGAVQSLSLIHI